MELVKNFTQFAKAQKQLAGLCDKIDVAYTEVRSALGGNRATWSIRPKWARAEEDTTSAEELKTFLEGLRDFIRQSSTHYVKTDVTFSDFDSQAMTHVTTQISEERISTKSENCLPEQNSYPLTFSQTTPISFEHREGLPQVSLSKYIDKDPLENKRVNYITEQVQLEDKVVEKPVALFHNLNPNQTQEIMEKKQKYEEEVQKDEVKKIVREHRSREKIIEKIEGSQDKMDQIRQEMRTRLDPQIKPQKSVLHGTTLKHNNLFNGNKTTANQVKSPAAQATFTPPSNLDKIENSKIQKLTISKPLTGQLHASKPYQRPALKKVAAIRRLHEAKAEAAKQAALSAAGYKPLMVRSKLGGIIKVANTTPLIKQQVYKGRPQQRPVVKSPVKYFVNKSNNSQKISRLYRPNFNNKIETAKPLNQKAPQVNVSNNNYRSNYLKQYRLAKELDRKRKHKSFTNIRFPSFYWQNKDNFKPSHKPSNIWSSFVGHNGKRPFANL